VRPPIRGITLRKTILRRTGRAASTGNLNAIETAGLASAAALCSVLWVGVAVPTLSVLPASGAERSRNVSIALESALLGIDDRSGRRVAAGTLADRIGLRSSPSLLPTLERLRVTAHELASRDRGASNATRALAVEIREQVLAEAAAASEVSDAPAAQPAPSTPPPSPTHEPAPAPAAVAAPVPPLRRHAAGAGAPPASGGDKNAGSPAGSTPGDDDAPVVFPSLPPGKSLALDGDSAPPAAGDDGGGVVDPGGPGQPDGGASGEATGNGQATGDTNGLGSGVGVGNGNASGQTNGNANGQANGPGNGNANGPGNGQGNGNANGQANGPGNGNANGQANGQGNGQANGQGNGQANGQGNGEANGNANGQGNGNEHGQGGH
jgi:hypothetical protein